MDTFAVSDLYLLLISFFEIAIRLFRILKTKAFYHLNVNILNAARDEHLGGARDLSGVPPQLPYL